MKRERHSISRIEGRQFRRSGQRFVAEPEQTCLGSAQKTGLRLPLRVRRGRPHKAVSSSSSGGSDTGPSFHRPYQRKSERQPKMQSPVSNQKPECDELAECGTQEKDKLTLSRRVVAPFLRTLEGGNPLGRKANLSGLLQNSGGSRIRLQRRRHKVFREVRISKPNPNKPGRGDEARASIFISLSRCHVFEKTGRKTWRIVARTNNGGRKELQQPLSDGVGSGVALQRNGSKVSRRKGRFK